MHKKIITDVMTIINQNSNERGLELMRFKEYVLEHFKQARAREVAPKQQLEELGLNVYNKRGIAFDDILIYFSNQEWINITDNQRVSLTVAGKDELMAIYTDNYSPEFQAFKQKVSALAEKYDEPNFRESHINSMFWNRWSLDKIEDQYFINIDDSITERANNVHQALLEAFHEPNINESTYLLHLVPKLFVDIDERFEAINLIIEGIETPDFVLSKPYPNKRYTVAGHKTKVDTGKAKGFYIHMGQKEEFPSTIEFTMKWFIGDVKEVHHHVKLQFKFTNGRLFSTVQDLRRGSIVEYFSLCSYTSKEDTVEFGKLPADQIISSFCNGKEIITINQTATLTSIPVKLHYIS